MAKSAHELLASSLETARAISFQNLVVRSVDLSRIHRERLLKADCLIPIYSGYYFLSSPLMERDLGSLYNQGYWVFMSRYLSDKTGGEYCLNPQASLNLHTGHENPPPQLVVISKKLSLPGIELSGGQRVVIYADEKRLPNHCDSLLDVKIMSLGTTLTRLGPRDYTDSRDQVLTAIRMVEQNELTRALLNEANLESAGRVMGAYRSIGWDQQAQHLAGSFESAGLTVKATNPFISGIPGRSYTPVKHPHAERVRVLWDTMREQVAEIMSSLPTRKPTPGELEKYLTQADALLPEDAYHSLSIEGYQVTPELIDKIRRSQWNPEGNPEDEDQVAAMAAKGYLESFQKVKASIGKVFAGTNPGEVANEDLSAWYQALFSPSVKAGLLRNADLAGYRDRQVLIRKSQHAPPSFRAVPDCMNAFFDLLKSESSPGARAVLGHFVFTFIHPYVDGNGRLARFLMNTMLASGGLPWTVIKEETRGDYLSALEAASIKQDIVPFAEFVRQNVAISLERVKTP